MSFDLVHTITWPKSGHYIVAVSGGVDSAALLALLAAEASARGYKLEIAHFNHGWPGDDAYEKTVRESVLRYNLPLHIEQGKTDRNEASARAGRYGFLRELAKHLKADGIITAHHLDDLEETITLNMLRGTGRRGLTPFTNQPDIVRPLVAVRKSELEAYAKDHALIWCHDDYNDDLTFRRNQVRHELLPKLRAANPDFDVQLSALLAEAAKLNAEIDSELDVLLTDTATCNDPRVSLPLKKLQSLDTDMLQELLLTAMRRLDPGVELDKRTIEELAVDIKTGRFKRQRNLSKQLSTDALHDTVTIVFTP